MSAPCGRLSEMEAGIAKERAARLLRFPDRILPAARCAGFRQAKSPGRVGRCRIPQRKSLRRMSGAFSLCIQSSPSPRLFSSQRAAIVLGAVIERALRAAQRDGGWNSRIGSPMCAACGGSSLGTMPGRAGRCREGLQNIFHPRRKLRRSAMRAHCIFQKKLKELPVFHSIFLSIPIIHRY